MKENKVLPLVDINPGSTRYGEITRQRDADVKRIKPLVEAVVDMLVWIEDITGSKPLPGCAVRAKQALAELEE